MKHLQRRRNQRQGSKCLFALLAPGYTAVSASLLASQVQAGRPGFATERCAEPPSPHGNTDLARDTVFVVVKRTGEAIATNPAQKRGLHNAGGRGRADRLHAHRCLRPAFELDATSDAFAAAREMRHRATTPPGARYL